MRYEFTDGMYGDPSNIVATIIDIESTGLSTGNSDEMVEVAIMHIDKELCPVKVIDYWFTPMQKFSPTSTQNAVGLSMIEIITRSDNMTILDHLPDLLKDLNEAQALGDFIAHNAQFDTRFIQDSLLKLQESFVFKAEKVKDSQNMYRRFYSGKTNLDSVMKELGIAETDVMDFLSGLGIEDYHRHTGVFDCAGVLLFMTEACSALAQEPNYALLK